MNNNLSGSGTLYKQGSNTVTYGGTSTLSGTINLAGGTFTEASTGSITGLTTHPIQLQCRGTWNINGPFSVTNFNGGVNNTVGYAGGNTITYNFGNLGQPVHIGTMTLSQSTSFVAGSNTIVNVLAGSTVNVGAVNMSFTSGPGYASASASLNLSGILNAPTILGIPSSGHFNGVQRYISVNAGWRA